MFCHKCGTQLPDGSAFCQKCGAKLTSDIKAQAAPASSPNKGVPVQPYPQQQAGIPAAHAQVPPQQYASPTFPPKKKSKAPKIILGILGGIFGLFVLLIIIGIVAGSDDTGSSQSSPSSAMEVNLSQNFVSEEDGIAFQYPSGWVPVKEEDFDDYVNGSDGETLVVLLNETEDLPENTTCIILSKYSATPEDEANLSKSEEDFIEEVQSDSYTIKSAPVIQLDGVPCRKFTAVDSNGNGYMIYSYINSSFLYQLEFSWVGKTPGSNQRFFDAIIDSYTITDTNIGDKSSAPTVSPVPAKTPAPVESAANAEPNSSPSVEEAKDCFGSDIELHNISDFSEGLAWVEYRDADRRSGSYQAMKDAAQAALGGPMDKLLNGLKYFNSEAPYYGGIIDTDGHLIWEVPLTGTSGMFRECTDFVDGIGCCRIQTDEGVVWMAVNKDGETILAREEGDDEFTVLGVGGGYVLMAEYVADFNNNGWRFGAINSAGEIVLPFKVYNEILPEGANGDGLSDYYNTYTPSTTNTKSHGEGIFELTLNDTRSLLNLNTQKVIYSESALYGKLLYFLSDFKDGSAMVLCQEKEGSRSVCTIDTNGNISEGTTNDWINQNISRLEFYDGLAFYEKEYAETMAALGAEGFYCDYYGNKVLDVPEYRGKRVYLGGNFQDGHAVVFVIGADQEWYLTAIDKDGQVLFEPKQGYITAFISDDGKYIAAVQQSALTVFDVNGKALLEVHYNQIGYDPLYGIPIDADGSYNGQKYRIKDGMLKVSDFYINVETKAVIGMHQMIDRNFDIKFY